MVLYSLAILGVSLGAGAIPLVAKRSDRLLHLFIAFATGVFLGVVFLHFLPEIGQMASESRSTAYVDSHEQGTDQRVAILREREQALGRGAGEFSANRALGGGSLWIFVLIGVVGLFVLEHLVFRSGHQPDVRQDDRIHSLEHSDRREHVTVGYAVLFGLSIHAFTAGLGLAAVANRPALAMSVFLSIISHKGVEGFSLTTVFMLAGLRLRRILLLILGFSLVTPAGVFLGSLVSRQLDGFGVEVMTALAAGTFLFVALCDLLPEVFHRRIDAAIKVLLLVMGVAVSCLIHI